MHLHLIFTTHMHVRIFLENARSPADSRRAARRGRRGRLTRLEALEQHAECQTLVGGTDADSRQCHAASELTKPFVSRMTRRHQAGGRGTGHLLPLLGAARRRAGLQRLERRDRAALLRAFPVCTPL